MPSINLSTGTVNYSEHGAGVPLVLLHANPGDSQDFEAVIPALAKQYRVLALDWPGNGQSDVYRPRLTRHSFVTQAVSFISLA